MIQCVVGLGNPGPDYASHRHNIGFWLLDRLAQSHHVTFRQEKRFHGLIAQLPTAAGNLWLLKPTTYMNQSGRAVRSLVHFYRLLPDQVLVVHDELDLPPGTVRLKQQGGHGGHNGLRDIIQALGTQAFPRLRIGIGHPGHKSAVLKHVLSAPGKIEDTQLQSALDQITVVWEHIYTGNWQSAMQTLHTQQ
ncbi:MAG: aminoacyl-tRNA hydrolase [Pseudomonadota bacterium]